MISAELLRISIIKQRVVVFGFKLASELDRTGYLQPNLFIEISKDNSVTLRIARQKFSRSTLNCLSSLLAQEIELDPETTKTAYLPNCPDTPDFSDEFEDVMKYCNSMKAAGRTVHNTLVSTAASQWCLPNRLCFAQRGLVFNQLNSNCISYYFLAEKCHQMTSNLASIHTKI